MVVDENNDVIRKYTLDTPPRVVREGSPRDPGAWPLAASQRYTWGLDLSRTVHGAGGIGGLLAAVETQGTVTTADDEAYWFFYDANGNVGQVIKASDQSVAARYEYDPYGNVIGPDDDNDGEWQDDAGPYATANPIRFSTKWFDTELAGAGTNGAVGTSGLGYWGYRYYSPRLGRWLSRDPTEESGGLPVYAFVSNGPVVHSDPKVICFTRQ